MAAASADAQLVGRKRRFSLPDNGGGLGAGVPLTAFLPSEFKRRRTATTAPSSPCFVVSPATSTAGSVEGSRAVLPCINELVQGAAMFAPVAATPSAMSHPEPCLPPHTAATPDHPRFVPNVSAPAPAPLLQTQAVPVPQPAMMTMTHDPLDVAAAAAASQTAFMYGNPGSSSTSPSSSTPSSPRMFGDSPASDLQQAREDAQADKARKAERVAEILDLMDRQNSGAGAVDASTAAFAAAADVSIESWPAGASDAAKRRRVGKDQTGILDLMFKVEPMPSQATKKRLADGLGMTYKQVQIWFQNKRARCKRAVEAPPRSSHTFHNMQVSHDGRFMMKELAKAQQQQQQQQQQQNDQASSNHLYEHHIPSHHGPSAAPPVSLRSCILTQ